MGLLDLFGVAPNSFSQWANASPYTLQAAGQGLQGFFGGMSGASNLHDALTGATKGLNGVNTPAYLQLQLQKQQQDKEAADAKAQQNATVAWIQKNAPKYYGAVQAGVMAPGDAYKMALQDANGGPVDQETWGLTPQAYRVNDQIKIGVLSNKGNFKEVPLPQGASAVFPVQQLNTGTQFQGRDRFGTPTGTPTPIDNQGAAQATAVGKTIGETIGSAAVTAPRAQLQATQAKAVADKILGNAAGLDEVFGNVFGIPQQMTPAYPGTKKADTLNDINELINKSWLQVRQDLKGAGQITDYEGAKAEAAVSQMGLALKSGSKEAFIQAVKDYKDAVDAGYRLIAQQAAQAGFQTPQQAPPAAPQTFVYNPQTGELEPQ